MADVVAPQVRSRIMASIRGGNTKPEMLVRRYLHSVGYRFRVNVKDLPGRPDLVLRRYNVVILVHGCFWHAHPNCKFATTPATRPDFWRAKLEGNRARDAKVYSDLRALGWRIAIVWECGLRKQLDSTLNALREFIPSDAEEVELGMETAGHALRNE